ncbi:MAG: alpha/beta hydrolase [Sphingomicrobium sp.]
MNVERRVFLGASIAAAAVASTAAKAQWGDPPTPAQGDPAAPFFPARERFPLWPGSPPGASAAKISANWTMNGPRNARELWIRGVPFAEVHVYRPALPDGSALLALPGGGYSFLSVQNEGLDVAQHFNPGGTTVFILTYRLPGEGWANRSVVPLQDAQRAMRLIRARAAEFRIDPKRLGAVGFSAGGHLGADLAVSYDEPVYKPIDAADRQSARPAFVGLVYPVVSMRQTDSGGRAISTLTGENPSAELIAARSPVLKVNEDTPPSFLVHAVDDGLVPFENSVTWLQACRKAGVPAESHIFSEGGHGFGLHLAKDLPGSRWPDLFNIWFRKHGG